MRSVVSVSIDDDLRRRIEVYQDEHGAKNFSAAVRELLEFGFETLDRQEGQRVEDGSGEPFERLYDALTTEPRSIETIAVDVGVSESEVLSMIEHLIDQEGEPIVIKQTKGTWFCWIEGTSPST